jgi:predicted nucleic acid-binding protein
VLESRRRLLDTDVTSYISRRRPEASDFLPHLRGYARAISFVTFGELLKGAREANWGSRRIADMERTVLDEHTILPYTVDVAREWGRLTAACSGRGYTPGQNDAWIAASALAFDLTLVARDMAFRTMARFEPRLRVVP